MAILSLVLGYAKVNTKWYVDGMLFFDAADSIYMGVFAMVLSFIIVFVVSLFTKAPDDVEQMFKCYHQKVISTSDVVLAEKEQIIEEELLD